MRTQLWVLTLLVLIVTVGFAALPAPAAARPTPAAPNVIEVQADDPPPDLLAAEEVARIKRIQGDALYAVPYSPVSPDDRFVLLISDETIGLLEINDGSLREIEPERLGPYLPLPLIGFSEFSWLDQHTLGALAVNMEATDADSVLVRMLINSESLEIWAEPLALPSSSSLVSIAPDLRHMLLALLPEEAQGEAVGRRSEVAWPGERPLPAFFERRIDEARRRFAPTFNRLRLLQEGEAPDPGAPEDEKIDLVLYADGEPGYRYITSVPAASALFGEAWTRDSRRLALSLIGTLDPLEERPTFDGALLSTEAYRDATGNLPPALNPILRNNNTYVIEVADGATQILRPNGGDAPPLLAAHAWSTDGATLLVQALYPARLRGRTYPVYEPQFSERIAFQFYDRSLREVSRLESSLFGAGVWSSTEAQFVSPDELIFRTNYGTDRHPYYYNRVSGELRSLADRVGAYYNVFSTNRSRQLVFMYTSFTNPPDVFRMGWDGRGLHRLTWFGEDLRNFVGLRQDAVRFNLPGGEVRSGVLIQPATAPFPPRNARIVIWQEGGPGPAMINRWDSSVERPFALLPGMGMALLVTPVAGRGGYSSAVFNRLADNANFGQVDIDEQAAIARELVQRGWASARGLGITGCSYGGYFTTQSIARYPELYAAANPQCALVDIVNEWTRGYDALAPYLQGLPPFRIPEEYRRDSPLYNAEQIKTPVLTFHGTDDFLPIVLNQNLHQQIVNRGVAARMLKFVGEGHGLQDEGNQLYAAQEQVAWFRQYLR